MFLLPGTMGLIKGSGTSSRRTSGRWCDTKSLVLSGRVDCRSVASIVITKEAYGHPVEGEKRDAAEAMSAMLPPPTTAG